MFFLWTERNNSCRVRFRVDSLGDHEAYIRNRRSDDCTACDHRLTSCYSNGNDRQHHSIDPPYSPDDAIVYFGLISCSLAHASMSHKWYIDRIRRFCSPPFYQSRSFPMGRTPKKVPLLVMGSASPSNI